MIFEIEDKNYYDRKLFDKKSFEIQPGITFLVGPNGSGKSTLLRHIKSTIEIRNREYNEGEKIPVIFYDNNSEGGSAARSNYGFYGNIMALAESFSSSEGENVKNDMCNILVSEMHKRIHKSNCKEAFILLDGIDSGVSIDQIRDFKDFFDFVLSKEPDKNIYIVISANSFEMVRDERCICATTLTEKTFKTYGNFERYIMKMREKKDKYIESYNSKNKTTKEDK